MNIALEEAVPPHFSKGWKRVSLPVLPGSNAWKTLCPSRLATSNVWNNLDQIFQTLEK